MPYLCSLVNKGEVYKKRDGKAVKYFLRITEQVSL